MSEFNKYEDKFMPVIPIYNCFHPVLRKKAAKIEEFDQSVKDLVTNMYETMYYTGNGVGLAGNQVGEEKSVIVMDLTVNTDSPFKQPVTMINPEINAFSDDEIEMQEGCLSIPEYYENVVRPAGIEITYWDLEMKEHKREVDGFLARVMQHEVDHLNGILIFDKISPLKRTLARSKFKKLQKGQIIPKYPMVQPDGTYTDGKED